MTLCSHAHIGGSHLFSVVNKDEETLKVLDVLWSCVGMVFLSSGISEVLIYFPFAPCRPFTTCLLLSSSCCSCTHRSCSISALHASEPTNTPALHSLLPCWGPALHELHCILPQVKQRRTQAATKKSFFFYCLQQMHKTHKRTLSALLRTCDTKNSLFSILFREKNSGQLGIFQVLEYCR